MALMLLSTVSTMLGNFLALTLVVASMQVLAPICCEMRLLWSKKWLQVWPGRPTSLLSFMKPAVVIVFLSACLNYTAVMVTGFLQTVPLIQCPTGHFIGYWRNARNGRLTRHAKFANSCKGIQNSPLPPESFGSGNVTDSSNLYRFPAPFTFVPLMTPRKPSCGIIPPMPKIKYLKPFHFQRSSWHELNLGLLLTSHHRQHLTQPLILWYTGQTVSTFFECQKIKRHPSKIAGFQRIQRGLKLGGPASNLRPSQAQPWIFIFVVEEEDAASFMKQPFGKVWDPKVKQYVLGLSQKDVWEI